MDTFIKKMCTDILTTADMKAIASVRDFDKKCLLSRDRFQKYFYSVVGLQQAIDSLTLEEKIFLYYMGDEWVNVDFFSALYKKPSDKKAYLFETYTQQYTDVYKLIQSNLIRKGVLLVRESYGDSKLERLQFNVPDLFSKYLPGPFIEKIQINAKIKTTVDETRLRNTISECLTEKNPDVIYLMNNKLHFDENIFSLKSIKSWQKRKWYRSCISQSAIKEKAIKSIFKKCITQAFQTLDKNDWVTPGALQPLINIICYPKEPIKSEKVFEAGYLFGCLKETFYNGKTYYSNVDLLKQDEEKLNQYDYLEPMNDGFLIDIKSIPYAQLAQLASVGSFSKLKNKLFVSFEFNDLARMDKAFLESPLLNWMRQQSSGLDNQIKQIQLKHGKILLHKNILIAKINDLRLKAHLVKAYKNAKEVIFLPNDFIVLPKVMKSEFEKLIKKVGYAIKTKIISAA